MRRLNLRKYCYVFLWLGLVLAVGGAWLFGRMGEEKPGIDTSLSSVPQSGIISGADATPLPVSAGGDMLRGVWVPYMSLENSGGDQKSFEEQFKAIADSAKKKGLNALFVHVRPFSDALYPSSLYPWSHILTGEQGKNPGFDPLGFMVEYAHSIQMQLHAWINPLRIKTEKTPKTLSKDHPYLVLKEEYPSYFMTYGEAVYWNPAAVYVRSLIADGAAEIVEKYEVDGIHFDDYFYPCKDESLDSEAYEVYTQNVEIPLSLPEWRTANINAMVAEVYQKVKKANPKVVFGISPQGNIDNDEGMGADVKTWSRTAGYIDYICPQLYYSFDNEALGYADALAQWMELPRHEGLKVYAGLALYKAGSDADEGTWLLQDDLISRQIQAADAAQCAGVVLYSSEYLETPQTKEEVENAMAYLLPENKAEKTTKNPPAA